MVTEMECLASRSGALARFPSSSQGITPALGRLSDGRMQKSA